MLTRSSSAPVAGDLGPLDARGGLWAFGCCPRPDPALCTPRGGRSPGPVRRLSLVHPAGPCCGVSSGLWLTRGRQGAWPCGVFYPVCLPAAGTRRLGWDNPTLLAPCHVSGVLPPGVVSRCLSPERGRGGGGGVPVKLKQAPVVIVFAGPPSPLLGSSLALPGLIDVVMWRSPGLGLKPRQMRDGRSW